MTLFECTILKRLADNVGEAVTREELIKALYPDGPKHADESNCLEVFVGRIRKKIGRHLIVTVRGVGYKLTELPEEMKPAQENVA
jgi:two-component system OmpR family response regulator